MKQKRVLGSVPRGLKWIEDIVESPQLEQEVQTAPELPTPEPVHLREALTETPVTASPAPKSSHEGLASGWTRATFIVKEEHLEKLKALSYWERLTIKELMADALGAYLHDKAVAPINKSKKITR
jgi:hypothetical protein